MRWKLSILVITLAVFACNLGAPTQSVPDVGPTPTLELSPIPETPTPVVVPASPSPQPTATYLPTVPPVPTKSAGNPITNENRIQFPAGGTWVEVGAYLDEGRSIQYVLSAMKNQVMSVSIEQSWPFTVEIADSTSLLTDPNYERPFWRGTLPVSGDYFLTVRTQAKGGFSMRVAINPPGQANQYFDYTNPQETITLRYSDEFAPTAYLPAGEFKGVPSLVLEFIRPDFYSPTTNLSEAYFMFSTMNDPQTVAGCTQPLPQLETVTGQKNINGYTFTQSAAIGVAAGNIYDQVIYRTVSNTICYEIVFYMHSGNIGNYTPGTVVEFDRAGLLNKFEQVLSTFSVK